MRMKRTNLVLDEQLLDDARKALGSRTYSEVVNLALRELLRHKTFAGIDRYAHSGVWEGDLSEMRGDENVPG
jgi:Arc/MetJ family transcription regulator